MSKVQKSRKVLRRGTRKPVQIHKTSPFSQTPKILGILYVVGADFDKVSEIAEWVRKVGHTIETFSTAKEVLDRLAQQKPNLIIQFAEMTDWGLYQREEDKLRRGGRNEFLLDTAIVIIVDSKWKHTKDYFHSATYPLQDLWFQEPLKKNKFIYDVNCFIYLYDTEVYRKQMEEIRMSERRRHPEWYQNVPENKLGIVQRIRLFFER